MFPFNSRRRVSTSLDVKAEGDGTQSPGQLLPQQDLLQLRRGSVLVEGEENGFRLSRIG